MKLVLQKDEVNCFWIYARSEGDMKKSISVASEMEYYGYAICHIDEEEKFIMLSAPEGETQATIREDYAAAKVA